MIKPTFPALKETCTVGSTIFDEHHDFQARCFRKHPARWETLSLSRGWYIYIIHSNPRKGRTGICHNLLIIYNSGIFNYRVNMPYITLVYPILVFFPFSILFKLSAGPGPWCLAATAVWSASRGSWDPQGRGDDWGFMGFFHHQRCFCFCFLDIGKMKFMVFFEIIGNTCNCCSKHL
jgi:hypothetical protein